MRPAVYASASAMGRLAAEVLPAWAMESWNRSIGRSSFLAAYLMMRSLAWWGTMQATSSSAMPARSSAWLTATVMASAANLNTFWPFM